MQAAAATQPSQSTAPRSAKGSAKSARAVWATLYDRRMPQLKSVASKVFLDGMNAIGLAADDVPTLEGVNEKLVPRTGWRAVEAAGFLPAKDFFESLAQRRFPTVTRVRSEEELDYTPEPDIFHDVFGHVPMHAHPVFADFLQRFGEVAARATTETARQRLTRLFWFTVEFGLIREKGCVKVYGSGLISSHGECAHSLSEDCLRRPFDLEDVMAQSFRHDEMQPVLFVIEDYWQLFDAIERAERMLMCGALDHPLENAVVEKHGRGCCDLV